MITIFIEEHNLDALLNDQPVAFWFQKPNYTNTIQVLLSYKELIELRKLNAIFEEQKKQQPLPF